MQDLIQTLMEQGLITSLPVDITTGQERGGPLTRDELLELAEIDAGDIADAAEAWNLTSGLPGLLDARTTTVKGKNQ